MKIDYLKYTEKIKQNKRPIKISLIVTGIVIFIVLALLIFLKINFMIGEQLRITLTPEYIEKNSSSPGIVSMDLDVQLYNKFVCVAVCNFTLTDLSHNTLLYNGTFNSKMYKNKEQTFDIALTDYGYGTNIYLYSVECNNIKTTLCPSTDDSLIRKSLMAVNYNPSLEQLSALNYSLDNYDIISNNVVNTLVMMREIDSVLYNINISFDTKNYSLIKSDLDLLNEDIRLMMNIWRTDDYSSVKNLIITKNLVVRSNNILSEAKIYMSYLNNTITRNNLVITDMHLIHSNLEYYRVIYSNIILSENKSIVYPDLNYTSIISAINSFNTPIRSTMLDSVKAGNIMIDKLNVKDYNSNSFELFYLNVLDLKNNLTVSNPIIINATLSRLSEQSAAIYIYSNILCIINADNTGVCNDYYASETGNVVLELSNISDASLKLTKVCDRSKIILNNSLTWNYDKKYLIYNDEGLNETTSTPYLFNDSLETLLLQYKLLIDYESINSKNTNYPKKIVALYKNYISNSLNELYNVSNPGELIQGYVFNSSLLTFNYNNIILSDINYINQSCNEDELNSGYSSAIESNISIVSSISNIIPDLSTVTLPYYIMPYINMSRDGISVITAPPIVRQCCMYDKCQSCEKKSSKNPLILLHGHSFNQNNYAYQSVEIFDDFEKRFSEDKLYYLSGIPTPEKYVTYGILGNYYVPLLSKPTYYIATYNDLLGLTSTDSKDDNIDTYALRLGESIDYTLQVTGSDKVDVVAHSMGGLVLRRYVQIFGTKKIGKVILIATPNNGISENKYSLCKLFGATSECDNMRSSGIFIKKLNDFSNQPNFEELYLVVGKGCDTDNEDGDGVVVLNSSIMANVAERNILFVEGKCSGTKLLHNDLLDSKEYPQVYEFVKSKLG